MSKTYKLTLAQRRAAKQALRDGEYRRLLKLRISEERRKQAIRVRRVEATSRKYAA